MEKRRCLQQHAGPQPDPGKPTVRLPGRWHVGEMRNEGSSSPPRPTFSPQPREHSPCNPFLAAGEYQNSPPPLESDAHRGTGTEPSCRDTRLQEGWAGPGCTQTFSEGAPSLAFSPAVPRTRRSRSTGPGAGMDTSAYITYYFFFKRKQDTCLWESSRFRASCQLQHEPSKPRPSPVRPGTVAWRGGTFRASFIPFFFSHSLKVLMSSSLNFGPFISEFTRGPRAALTGLFL